MNVYNIKKLLLVSAAGAAGVVCLSSALAGTFDDHTKIRQLRGEPFQKGAPYDCAAGQVFSGGQCVVISNQASAYDRPWTSYFIGQSKCESSGYCFSIGAAGEVIPVGDFGLPVSPAPVGRAKVEYTVQHGNACAGYWNSTVGVAPELTSAQVLNGEAPTNWSVFTTSGNGYHGTGGCGS